MDCNTLVNDYDVNSIPKTNFQRWLHYLRYVESPNSFVVMSFYAAISSALQRRVWKWHGDVKCYPNDFFILVGGPGVGKGRVIKPFKDLFKGFTYDRELVAYDEQGHPMITDTRPMADEVEDDEKKMLINEAKEMMGDTKKSGLVDDALFPCPANSSSLRALTCYLSQSPRIIRYFENNSVGERVKKGYLHASAMIVLEEIVSLFKDRRETKDMVDFLVQAWDAGEYKHATLEYGIDNIVNCCVTMLAGTVPETMEDLFSQKLMGAGLSARTIFIYENEQRFKRYPMNVEISESQKQAFKDLRIHIKHLAHVYGKVTFSREAEEYLKHWYEVEDNENTRANRNSKLTGYYVRKMAHIIKLSLAIHFSEHLDRFVSLEEVKLAMDILASLEVNMHKALRVGGRNDAFGVQKRIYNCIKRYGPIGAPSILLEFIEDLRDINELISILDTMVTVGSIVKEGSKYRTPKNEKEIA